MMDNDKAQDSSQFDSALEQAEAAKRETQAVAVASSPYATTTPTKPGYYWWENSNHREIVDVYVRAGSVYVQRFGCNASHITNFDGLWSGPLEAP